MADEEFQQSILKAHNDYRSNHEGTPSVAWSDDLANQAQEWANHLAQLGELEHASAKERKGQGENLVGCKAGRELTGEVATKKWYSFIEEFDFDSKGFHHNTGHFTQVVWKSSLEIGAGIATAEDGTSFCVVRYFPAGNYKGRYDENVGDLLDTPQSQEEMGELRTQFQERSRQEEEQRKFDSNPENQTWKDACLKSHNDFRAQHEDTPPLIWNDFLALEAQQYANRLATTEVAEHSEEEDRQGQGENIAWTKEKQITGVSACAHWYSEIKDFDFKNKCFDITTGHFTQLIWKESTEMGAGMAVSEDGWNFVVARYSPPGNIKGGYDEHCGNIIGAAAADEEPMEEAVIINFEESAGEMIRQATIEVVDDDAGELKEEATAEQIEENVGELKEEATGEVKEEATGELKEEATGELKEEATDELKEEAMGEVKEEATGEVKEEATAELKEEVTEEVKEEASEELKEEATGELKEEATEELKEEVMVEMNGDATGEVIEEATSEIKEEASGELIEDTASDLKEEATNGEEEATDEVVEMDAGDLGEETTGEVTEKKKKKKKKKDKKEKEEGDPEEENTGEVSEEKKKKKKKERKEKEAGDLEEETTGEGTEEKKKKKKKEKKEKSVSSEN